MKKPGASARSALPPAIQGAAILPLIEPIIPVPVKRRSVYAGAFDDPASIFELKYDGFRGILYYDGCNCRLVSKRGKRLPFPALERQLAGHIQSRRYARQGLILDGEVVALDPSGRPIFMDLVKRTGTIAYIAFDLLWHNGKDWRELPLAARKQALSRIARREAAGVLRGAFFVRETGVRFFKIIQAQDLEGMIAKSLQSPYGPRTRWHKIKNPSYSQLHDGRDAFNAP